MTAVYVEPPSVEYETLVIVPEVLDATCTMTCWVVVPVYVTPPAAILPSVLAAVEDDGSTTAALPLEPMTMPLTVASWAALMFTL